MVPGHPDPTAVMGRRYLAFIIDDILLTVVVGAVAALTVQYTEVPFGLSCSSLRNSALCFSNGNTTYLVEQADLVWAYVAWGVYVVLVFWLLQGLTGASPGKAICGIRTVRADGRPCGVGRAVVRSVLLVVDLIGCVVPLVGPITAGVSKGHKRVGDMAAGTFVVGKAAVGTPVVVPGAAAPVATPAYGAPQTYGAPGAYGAPAAGPQPAPTAPAAPAAPAAGPAGSPPAPDAQWDPQRGTWVRWDGAQWTAHDAASGSWRPI
ncbi:MAG: RDD family protein [Acidimicrobiales bacterium]